MTTTNKAFTLSSLLHLFWAVQYKETRPHRKKARQTTDDEWTSFCKNRCIELNNGLGWALQHVLDQQHSIVHRETGARVTQLLSVAGKRGKEEHTWLRLVFDDGAVLRLDLSAFQFGTRSKHLGVYPLASDFQVSSSQCDHCWIDDEHEVKCIARRIEELKSISVGLAALPAADVCTAAQYDEMATLCQRFEELQLVHSAFTRQAATSGV